MGHRRSSRDLEGLDCGDEQAAALLRRFTAGWLASGGESGGTCLLWWAMARGPDHGGILIAAERGG